MKKLNKEAVKSLIKNYPNIKINNIMYLIFEKPKNYSKHIKDYLIKIIELLYSFVSAPFLIVYYSFKYIRTFIPILIIENKKENQPQVYVPDKDKVFERENGI